MKEDFEDLKSMQKIVDEEIDRAVDEMEAQSDDVSKSRLFDHAKRELKKIADQRTDGIIPWPESCVVELIQMLASQGHSGTSLWYIVEQFRLLANWQPLTPLTGEKDEWEPSEHATNLYQNKRCSSVFWDRNVQNSDKEFFDTDVIIHQPYVNKKTGKIEYDTFYGGTHVPITFPYMPKTTHIYKQLEHLND